MKTIRRSLMLALLAATLLLATDTAKTAQPSAVSASVAAVAGPVSPLVPLAASSRCYPTVPAQLTAEQTAMAALLRETFPAEVGDAIVQIGWRESRLTAEAHNHNRNGTIDRGVLQINSIHTARARKLGLLPLTNPRNNVRMGFDLYQREGLKPWRCRG